MTPREIVARIVDRKAWASLDAYYREAAARCNREDTVDRGRFADPASLARADEILAALSYAGIVEALEPFAQAAKDADEETVPDTASAWESAMAMTVTFGDFRRAAQALKGAQP